MRLGKESVTVRSVGVSTPFCVVYQKLPPFFTEIRRVEGSDPQLVDTELLAASFPEPGASERLTVVARTALILRTARDWWALAALIESASCEHWGSDSLSSTCLISLRLLKMLHLLQEVFDGLSFSDLARVMRRATSV